MSEVKTYQQTDAPSDTTPGTTWLRDNGTKAQRGPTGDWIEKGSWTEENDGFLPVAGGTMLGPIAGAHGLAPVDDPAFTGTMTLEGAEMASKTWVTEQLDDRDASLQAYITELVSGAGSNSSLSNNIASDYGTITDGQTIELPLYADGTRADLSEVKILMVSANNISHYDGSEANWMYHYASVNPDTLVVTVRTESSRWPARAGTANYLIECRR